MDTASVWSFENVFDRSNTTNLSEDSNGNANNGDGDYFPVDPRVVKILAIVVGALGGSLFIFLAFVWCRRFTKGQRWNWREQIWQRRGRSGTAGEGQV